MINNIAVFCGSSMGYDPVYRKAASELALLLASKKIGLIYGGANVGLMKILADTMLRNGGKVTGIMPRSIADKEVAHLGITRMHIVNSMAERKEMMAVMSDAFIAMPGGFGTLDELTELITYNQLRIHDKAVGMLNTDSFFDHLISFLNHGVKEGFVRKEHFDNLIISDNPETLLHKLGNYKPVEMDKWIRDIKEESAHD
jgi:hypothetical protein